MDFDKLQVSEVYKAARTLPQVTMDMWAELLLKHVDKSKINYILDLGCGTGKFSVWLAEVFDAKVIGIDPAKSMLEEAKKVASDKVNFREGRAENILLEDESVDLVFMSMMYHTVDSKSQTLKEVLRVLRVGGIVAMRQATKDSNRLCKFLEYFPESVEIANNFISTNEEIIGDFETKGFKLVHSENVMQKVASSYAEFFEQVKLRGISIIRMLPEEIYKKRLEEFKEYTNAHAEEPVIDSRALFIFRK